MERVARKRKYKTKQRVDFPVILEWEALLIYILPKELTRIITRYYFSWKEEMKLTKIPDLGVSLPSLWHKHQFAGYIYTQHLGFLYRDAVNGPIKGLLIKVLPQYDDDEEWKRKLYVCNMGNRLEKEEPVLCVLERHPTLPMLLASTCWLVSGFEKVNEFWEFVDLLSL